MATFYGFRVRYQDAAPLGDAAFAAAPAAVKRAFMQQVVEWVLEAKDKELAAGLDVTGAPMAALSPRTIERRHSEMGPADPTAPPLEPAWGLSRTRSLLQGRYRGDVATFDWAYDEHTGGSWGKILSYHKKGDRARHLPKRNVIGLSPQSMAEVRQRARDWVHRWKSTGRVPAAQPAQRGAMPAGVTPSPYLVSTVQAYKPQFPELAVPERNRVVSQIGINGNIYTLGAGVGNKASAAAITRGIANGTFSGFRDTSHEERQRQTAEILARLRARAGRSTPSTPPPPPPTPARPAPTRPLPSRPINAFGRAAAIEPPVVVSQPQPVPINAFGTRGETISQPPTYGLSAARVVVARGAKAPVDQLTKGWFGKKLSPAELASIAGAPDHAVATVNAQPLAFTVEWELPEGGRAKRTFSFNPAAGGPVVHNDVFKIPAGSRGGGLGAQVFGRQVEALTKLGAVRIDTYAYRNDTDGWIGYKVWPKFGYDGFIPEHVRRKLPPELAAKRRVSELLETPEGMTWWETNGDSFDATFDLRPGSPSRQRWEAYLRAKAAQQTPPTPATSPTSLTTT